MESKVIEQKNGMSIEIDAVFDDRCVFLLQENDNIIIDKSKLPDLIAALQSFLPKETSIYKYKGR